jgi:hypothetical protein
MTQNSPLAGLFEPLGGPETRHRIRQRQQMALDKRAKGSDLSLMGPSRNASPMRASGRGTDNRSTRSQELCRAAKTEAAKEAADGR